MMTIIHEHKVCVRSATLAQSETQLEELKNL